MLPPDYPWVANATFVGLGPFQEVSGTASMLLVAQRIVSPEEVVAMREAGLPDAFWSGRWTVDGEVVEGYGQNLDGYKTIPSQGDGPFPIVSQAVSPIDTTLLPNGLHRFVTGLISPIGSTDIGAADIKLFVNNPTKIIGLDLEYAELRLQVGQTQYMASRSIDNNGSFQGLLYEKIKWTSSDEKVVKLLLDYPAYINIQAVSVGQATISATLDDKSSTCRVIVTDGPVACKHHSLDGSILSVYTPGRSCLPMSMFNASPEWLGCNPGFLTPLSTPQWFTDAGLDCESRLADGVTSHTSLDNAIASFENLRPRLQWAKDRGIGVTLTGDDLFEGPRLMELLTPTQSWASDYSKYICYCMEAVSSFNIAPRLEAWDEAIIGADDQHKVMAYYNNAKSRPAITWPCRAAMPIDLAVVQMGPGQSDYATHYVTAPFFFGLPLSYSLPDWRSILESVYLPRRALLPVDWPWTAMQNVCGETYWKWVGGDSFHPFQDRLVDGAAPPACITAGVWLAFAYGACGLRFYTFTTTHPQSRRIATLGDECVVACDPIQDNGGRWDALAAATSTAKKIYPHLLQPMVSAINAGRTFVTGAKSGTLSKVLIVINFSELTQTAFIDLRPYMTRKTMLCYRIACQKAESPKAEGRTLVTDRFLPGEVRIYISDF